MKSQLKVIAEEWTINKFVTLREFGLPIVDMESFNKAVGTNIPVWYHELYIVIETTVERLSRSLESRAVAKGGV